MFVFRRVQVDPLSVEEIWNCAAAPPYARATAVADIATKTDNLRSNSFIRISFSLIRFRMLSQRLQRNLADEEPARPLRDDGRPAVFADIGAGIDIEHRPVRMHLHDRKGPVRSMDGVRTRRAARHRTAVDHAHRPGLAHRIAAVVLVSVDEEIAAVPPGDVKQLPAVVASAVLLAGVHDRAFEVVVSENDRPMADEDDVPDARIGRRRRHLPFHELKGRVRDLPRGTILPLRRRQAHIAGEECDEPRVTGREGAVNTAYAVALRMRNPRARDSA